MEMDPNLNGYLVESQADGKIIGFFYGIYHQIKTSPSVDCLTKRLKQIRLQPFNPFIEQDELAEFRLLNHKNRIIIQCYPNQQQQQSTGDLSMIWFGYDEEKKRFITFNTNGILVLCGHVSILSTMNNDETSSSLEHYEGTCTVNLFNNLSLIEFDNEYGKDIRIHLLSSSSSSSSMDGDHSNQFAINMKIPYRFLQRSISHRQRNMLKIDNKNDDQNNDDGDNHNDNDTIESLMSLETFDHLLY